MWSDSSKERCPLWQERHGARARGHCSCHNRGHKAEGLKASAQTHFLLFIKSESPAHERELPMVWVGLQINLL